MKLFQHFQASVWIHHQDQSWTESFYNVTAILAQQVDLMGQSIYDYAHPCDHDEIREQLSDRPGLTLTTLPSATSKRKHHGFLMRVKCTLTPKGKIVNLKAASYKVRPLRVGWQTEYMDKAVDI